MVRVSKWDDEIGDESDCGHQVPAAQEARSMGARD